MCCCFLIIRYGADVVYEGDGEAVLPSHGAIGGVKGKDVAFVGWYKDEAVGGCHWGWGNFVAVAGVRLPKFNRCVTGNIYC